MVHRRKPSQRRVIHPCPVVVQVQALRRIQFLAVILVGLHKRSRCKQASEGIVMVGFLHGSGLADHHPVVPLMVFQVVVILLVSQGDVSFLRQQQLLHAVFIDHVAAIVRSGGRTA